MPRKHTCGLVPEEALQPLGQGARNKRNKKGTAEDWRQVSQGVVIPIMARGQGAQLMDICHALLTREASQVLFPDSSMHLRGVQ